MNFVYWFLDSPRLHFIIILLIMAVIVSIDVRKRYLHFILLIFPCFYIFSFWFPDYPKEILSEEHYIEFGVYQEEQKQKKEQEKIRQEQEERMKQQ